MGKTDKDIELVKENAWRNEEKHWYNAIYIYIAYCKLDHIYSKINHTQI